MTGPTPDTQRKAAKENWKADLCQQSHLLSSALYMPSGFVCAVAGTPTPKLRINMQDKRLLKTKCYYDINQRLLDSPLCHLWLCFSCVTYDFGSGRCWVKISEKGARYRMTREDGTLGGGHMAQHTDLVTYKPTPETYMIRLTNVTPINVILKMIF